MDVKQRIRQLELSLRDRNLCDWERERIQQHIHYLQVEQPKQHTKRKRVQHRKRK